MAAKIQTILLYIQDILHLKHFENVCTPVSEELFFTYTSKYGF